jgi:hypothetical protein
MADLHELKHIMETFLNEILKGHLGVEQTPLYGLAKDTRYGYYHSDKDKLGEVQPAGEIAKIDKALFKLSKEDSENSFPEFGPFFRGCISISRNKTDAK